MRLLREDYRPQVVLFANKVRISQLDASKKTITEMVEKMTWLQIWGYVILKITHYNF